MNYNDILQNLKNYNGRNIKKNLAPTCLLTGVKLPEASWLWPWPPAAGAEGPAVCSVCISPYFYMFKPRGSAHAQPGHVGPIISAV